MLAQEQRQGVGINWAQYHTEDERTPELVKRNRTHSGTGPLKPETIPSVPIYYLAKPQPRERAWQNQRGKKTLLSLTLV
ncbi:hypothetical protein T08_14728 [Trichinella sp. T8]|nr:hypothetical protein T08_14728 [Trichinella sp. T8]